MDIISTPKEMTRCAKAARMAKRANRVRTDHGMSARRASCSDARRSSACIDRRRVGAVRPREHDRQQEWNANY